LEDEGNWGKRAGQEIKNKRNAPLVLPWEPGTRTCFYPFIKSFTAIKV
jgi:hypothetical protein